MKNTGLLDRNGQPIYENEIIMVGMRECDSNGWTTEQVVNLRKGWRRWLFKPVWALINPQRPHDGLMDMQMNQNLRQKISSI